jgi:solute:Na+ symporter, SSS family
MQTLDIAIVGVYLLVMVGVGWWVARLASRNAESYFLAGKSLPWYLIGIAHGSSGIDITGTIWFVTMLFIYGVKGIWLLWIWPLFNVIFRMVYLGAWVRRSNVLTGAEWMRTRFGAGVGGELAYLSVVVYAMVSVVGFLSYAFQGLAKFCQPFIPWAGVTPGTFAAVIMIVTGVYCVVGGMYSVVWNDLIQFTLMFVAAVVVAVVAMMATTPEAIMAKVPADWDNLFFGWRLGLDWSGLIPELNERIHGASGDGYSFFFLFILMLLVKGIFVSMAGPTPNYAIQHVLSTRNPREAALENMVMSVVSLGPRFLLIGGIAVLGIVFYSGELAGMGSRVDFELILPKVINDHLPVGCRGLLVAGLLAAFMSTFVSTVNSGAAYVVNDVYRRYLHPGASPRRLVVLGYLSSLVVIGLGIGFGFMTDSVHSVTKWIVTALVPAFVAPNVLKWHWWRFNGWGFFAGMVAGTAAAVVVPQFGLHPVLGFMPILGLSALASVVVCLLTPAEPPEILEGFYRSIRPWGWWRPVHEACVAETPLLERNREVGWDILNVIVGMIWQIGMVSFPIYLVLQQYGRAGLSLGVFAFTSLVLKFTWYDRLNSGDMYLERDR